MRGITIGPNIIKATLFHESVVALIILLSGTLPRNINKPFSRMSPPDTPMMSTPQAAKAVVMVQLSSISSPSGIPSKPFIFTIMITPGPPGSLSLSIAARMRLSTSQGHCMRSYSGTPALSLGDRYCDIRYPWPQCISKQSKPLRTATNEACIKSFATLSRSSLFMARQKLKCPGLKMLCADICSCFFPDSTRFRSEK